MEYDYIIDLERISDIQKNYNECCKSFEEKCENLANSALANSEGIISSLYASVIKKYNNLKLLNNKVNNVWADYIAKIVDTENNLSKDERLNVSMGPFPRIISTNNLKLSSETRYMMGLIKSGPLWGAKEFYEYTQKNYPGVDENGNIKVGINIDGAAGSQCVDGFKLWCDMQGIPMYATGANNAGGYFSENTKQIIEKDGYLECIEMADLDELKEGDWIVWKQGSAAYSNSHIAMYYNGMIYGQNQQGANDGFSETNVIDDKGNNRLDSAVGVIRFVQSPEDAEEKSELKYSKDGI